METHVIILGDGTRIEAALNGNNYIVESPVDDNLLADSNLIGMTIDGVKQVNTTCCNHFIDEEGDHLIFRQYSSNELEFQRINANMDFIAMMADIEL